VSGDTLSRRALGRATLERQLLLRRSDMAVLDTVSHLVGMQAQLPMNPYALSAEGRRFLRFLLTDAETPRRPLRRPRLKASFVLVTELHAPA